MAAHRSTMIAFVVCGVGVALLASLAMLNRRDQLAHLNEEIQYDDFAFSVLGSERAPSIGTGPAAVSAKGVFCVITMKVANHAKRVDFTFRPETVMLVDEHGREYHLQTDLQKRLDTARGGVGCRGAIPAGGSCITQLAFDVAADAQVLDVRMSFANHFTDLLDLVFWGSKRIRLRS